MAFRMYWPTDHNTITQEFGARPEYYSRFNLPGHEGLDFQAGVGDRIYAVADGVVSEVRLEGYMDRLARPYGNQVRIQHEGEQYTSVYAHLSKALVIDGQAVKAGQLIGLGGDTGNCEGAHLHLTLKKRGASQAGETQFGFDIVDPKPYLAPFSKPGGTPLAPPAQAAFEVEVFDTGEVQLNVRSEPRIGDNVICKQPDGARLGVLEDEAIARRKLRQEDQWLWVRLPNGQIGYVAVRYVRLPGQAAPTPVAPLQQLNPSSGQVRHMIVESPEYGLRLREGPSTEHKQTWWVPHKTPLESLESPGATGSKLGQRDQWIEVITPARKRGYMAACYLRPPWVEDARTPASKSDLPKGISPHIFGIHAATLGDDPDTKDAIRGVFGGKKGWVFFTEAIGCRAQDLQPDERRNWLWEWASQGYGVIVRLNHGYEPAGTLPESRYYDDFAAACARYAELYLKRPELGPEAYTWVIQIGNEQNNPREHPGGSEHPTEHITAELYAQAFNKAYERIKQVLPNAIVCPGAIDPYNYIPLKWRPLDYYQEMLGHIQNLDGIVLHAYTHGLSLDALTHLRAFDAAGPLSDHYYDFQTYRLFMEKIPARWREVPCYITETNHLYRGQDQNRLGWENTNSGWVRKMYDEIHAWNSTPFAQQIHAVLLYRWMPDEWTIRDKPGVLDDFRQALSNDYRWRSKTGMETVSFEPIAAKPVEERRLVKQDELRRIRGIGPKTEATLRAAGIGFFEQVAAIKPGQLRAILNEAGCPAHGVATWPKQAKKLLRKR